MGQRVQERMIKRENIYYIMLLLVLFMAVGFFGFQTMNSQLSMLQEIGEREMQDVYQLAGAAAQEEGNGVFHLTQVLLGRRNEAFIEKGREILGQKGYTGYNISFQKYLDEAGSRIKRQSAMQAAALLAVIYGVLFIVKRKQDQELKIYCKILENFTKGKYEYSVSYMQEGVRGEISHLFDSLGNMMRLKESRLKEEKEGTKALVTDISHQLKTPLSSLKTCFSLLGEDGLTDSEKEEFLERSRIQITRLEGLVAALVNISRLETGLIEIKPVATDLKETIVQAAASYYVKADEKNIKIEAEELEPVMVYHDEKWTKEAISNILDNSIKYSGPYTTVKIRMVKLHSYVKIELEDEGIGIRKEEYTEIFKRFYRGRSETVKRLDGSGVGLYLTRKILEEQGGNITVKGRQQGKGCIFVIKMPLLTYL